MTVFDAHTHVFADGQRERRAATVEEDATFAELYGNPAARMATGAELLAAMDAAGVDRAAAAGFAFAGEAELREQGVALVRLSDETAGRIVALPALNLALPGWRGMAEEWLAAGARGFGELRPHNQVWDPLGPASQELCELAAARSAVLLWHVSEPVGHTYPGKAGGISPADLCALAAAHPGTTMIAAHQGGGLSFYLQMPEIRKAIENVYYDTAASSLLYDDWSVARLVDLAGSKRVLFASDYPLLSPRRQLERMREVLGPEPARDVCGGNAERLFG